MEDKKQYKGGLTMEKVIYKEQRGKNKTALGLKNKEAVRNWFLAHAEGGTQAACCADLGLSRVTVGQHLKAILEEQNS